MLQTFIQPIIDYLHNNPESTGIIVYFIACSEALAVVGTIIPGSVIMTAIGILIGSHIISPSITIVCAILGAITGDLISYWLGRYYKNRIHKIWPFTRHPHWLEKGENFFKKHGGKSIILGRFLGPIRCLVPLIAGTFKMGQIRFLIVAIPSAAAWAVGYLLPGILVGALSLELPPKLALQFIIAVLAIILFVVLFSWGAHYFFSFIGETINRKIKNLWHFLQTHKQTHWFTELLTDPRNPENHTQIILLFYAIITSLIFMFILGNVEYQGWLTFLNVPLFNLLQSLRTNIGDNIFILITELGAPEVMLSAAVLIFAWLAYRRYWRAAIHWVALVFAASWSIHVFKSLFHFPRPEGFMIIDTTSCFPSGHTLLTISLLGFLAVLINQEIAIKKHRLTFLVAIITAIIVGISRLYLGAHWLTDVLGALFLGATLVLLVTISYKRTHNKHLPITKFIRVILISFLLTWIVFAALNFRDLKYAFTSNWALQSQKLTLSDWQKHRNYQPIFRTNRFGAPIEAINIEWFSDLKNIKKTLEEQGWKNQDTSLSLVGFLQNVSKQNNGFRLPIFPQLYQNQRPSLLMTKRIQINAENLPGNETATKDKATWIIMLRLWPANMQIQNSDTPMWVGIVNYYKAPQKLFTIKKHKSKKPFLGATDELLPDLKNYYHVNVIQYPIDQQPSFVQHLHWDGIMLLISP